jgi:hypothetical protein
MSLSKEVPWKPILLRPLNEGRNEGRRIGKGD